MLHCINCGAKLPEAANFCAKCGSAKFEEETPGDDPLMELAKLAASGIQSDGTADDRNAEKPLDEEYLASSSINTEATTEPQDIDDGSDSESESESTGSTWIEKMLVAGLLVGLIYTFAGDMIVSMFSSQTHSEIWQETLEKNGRADFAAFLDQYPTSTYAPLAKSRIAAIDNVIKEKRKQDDIAFQSASNDTRIKAFHAYVLEFPDGAHVNEAIEGAWASAKRQSNTDAFEAFLYKFWYSPYRDEANTILVNYYKSEAAKNVELAAKLEAQATKHKSEAAERVRNKQSGCIAGKCIGGEGIWVSDEGDMYAGYSDDDGKLHGDGIKVYYSSGAHYEGGFKLNKRHGANSKYYYNDGDHYVGNFVDGIFEGEGTYFYADGGWYSGAYLKDQMHDTFATRIFPDGDRYIGKYFQNNWTGRGRYIWADGRMYDGDFQNGKFHGKGKFYDSTGALAYYGRYENDDRMDEGSGSLMKLVAGGVGALGTVFAKDKASTSTSKKRRRKKRR